MHRHAFHFAVLIGLIMSGCVMDAMPEQAEGITSSATWTEQAPAHPASSATLGATSRTGEQAQAQAQARIDEVSAAAICVPGFCMDVSDCEPCTGYTVTCSPPGVCQYSRDGGGGGGGGGPHCPAAFCIDHLDCLAACSEADTAECIGNVCYY